MPYGKFLAVDGAESSFNQPLPPGKILQSVEIRAGSTSGPIHAEMLIRDLIVDFKHTLNRGWFEDQGQTSENSLSWTGNWKIPSDQDYRLSIFCRNNTGEDRTIEVSWSFAGDEI